MSEPPLASRVCRYFVCAITSSEFARQSRRYCCQRWCWWYPWRHWVFIGIFSSCQCCYCCCLSIVLSCFFLWPCSPKVWRQILFTGWSCWTQPAPVLCPAVASIKLPIHTTPGKAVCGSSRLCWIVAQVNHAESCLTRPPPPHVLCAQYAPSIVQYATLHSFTLHSFTLHSFTLHSFTLHSFTLHSFTLHSFTLHSFTLHSFTLHSFTLHSFTLHSFTCTRVPTYGVAFAAAMTESTPAYICLSVCVCMCLCVFSTTILPPEDLLTDMMDRISSFHRQFTQQYS